jgi:hypothetical protein
MADEEEEPKYKTWKDWLVAYSWLIIAVVFWLLMHGRMGTSSLDTATFYAAGFIVLVLFAKSAYTTFSDKTAKIVFNPGHNTTDGSFDVVGNFAVIRPAIRSFGMYWKKDGAYVAPVDAIHKEGRNLVLTCKMDLVELGELPLEVRSFLAQENIKPPYYLGFADEEQYHQFLDDPEKASGMEKPSVGYLIDEIKKVNKQVFLREKILGGDIKVIEEFVAGSSRISQTAKGGILEAIKKATLEEGG